MNKLKSIVKKLISHKHEEEWLEFKENWFESHALGEYISGMSNAAAMGCIYNFINMQYLHRWG